jgi:GR25 family glycosyltransferase involved in LPS biosynthesis
MTNFILRSKQFSGKDFAFVKEGFGSIFQYILNEISVISYIDTMDKKFNIYYLYSKISDIGHCPSNMKQEDWDSIINNYMFSLIPDKYKFDVNLLQNKQVGVAEMTIQNTIPFFTELIETGKKIDIDYILINLTNIDKGYLDQYLDYLTPNLIMDKKNNKFIISLHIRRENKNDNPNESVVRREYYIKSSPIYNELTKYYNTLLNLFKSIPNSEIHIFSQGDISDFNDLNLPKNIFFHLDDDLTSNMNFMISSDIIVLSKSSLSAIINYYSKGINIMRESFWHTLKSDTICIKNNDFSILKEKLKLEEKDEKDKNFITLSEMGNNYARLGNQIFQFMFMLSVAKQKNLSIKINNHKEDNVYKQTKITELFDFPFEYLLQSDKTDLFEYKEKSLLYDSNYINNIPSNKNITICGYFQTEKYFKDIVPIPKIKSELMTFANNVMNRIKKDNNKIISLHIRRGDNNHYSGLNLMLNTKFISNAINYIRNKDKSADTLLVFTDDKEWCQNNAQYFSTSSLSIIISSSFTDVQDLALMSLCDHFIISSSSFGWWGAYLGKKSHSIIISPDRWFNIRHVDGKRLVSEESDIIPDDWTKLPLYPLDNMDIYCISLERASDRRQYSYKVLNLLFGMDNWTMFNAFDKKLITYKGNKDGIDVFSYDNKVEFNHVRSAREKKMSKGEFGCALSHYYMYQDLFKSNKNARLIFEDDFDINYLDKDEFNEYLINLPPFDTFDICLLMTTDHLSWFKLEYDNKVNEYYSTLKPTGFATLRSYIITKRGVDKIAKYFNHDNKLNIVLPADDLISILMKQRAITIIASNKLFITQRKISSEIWSDESDNNVSWDNKSNLETRKNDIIKNSPMSFCQLGFGAICDLIICNRTRGIENPITDKDFENLKDGSKVFININLYDEYVDKLMKLLKNIKVYFYIMIEPETRIPEIVDKLHPHAYKIFIQNNNVHKENVHIMPIGIRDSMEVFSSHAPFSHNQLIYQGNCILEKQNLCMMCFSLNIHREECYNTLKDKNYILDLNNKNFGKFQPSFLGTIPVQINYNLTQLSYYVICPRGIGEDTHRFFETIYLNSIPIVRRTNTAFDKMFDVFPCFIVNDWSDISEELLLKNKDILLEKVVEFNKQHNDIFYNMNKLHQLMEKL